MYSLLQKFRATLFIVVFLVKFLHGPQTLLKLPFAVIALLLSLLCFSMLDCKELNKKLKIL